jgi:hypothetical protein
MPFDDSVPKRQFRLFIDIGEDGVATWGQISEALKNTAQTILADHTEFDCIERGNYQNVRMDGGMVVGVYGVKDDKLKVV